VIFITNITVRDVTLNLCYSSQIRYPIVWTIDWFELPNRF
jgi:hypothetical protein